MPSTAENTTKLLNFISQKYQTGELDDDGLVKIIKLCGEDYLNLKTVAKYASDNGISYPGAQKCRELISIFNVNFIKDNQ